MNNPDEPEVATNLDAISITLETKDHLSDSYTMLLESNTCLHYADDFYMIPSSTKIGTPLNVANDREMVITSKVLEHYADFIQP